jgi:anti-anti-sigma regulatory factor
MHLGLIATVREANELLALAQTAAGTTTDVVVDCAETERCDVAALQVLLALRAALARRGLSLYLADVPESIAWRFDLVGLASAPLELTSSLTHAPL